jgi:putative nucleotidyltransferase with HDIG domain
MGGDRGRCLRCGREPYEDRLVEGLCARCRALKFVDTLDDGLVGHSRRVTCLAMLVADRLGVHPAVRAGVEIGGLLHDIGKLATPARILTKSGPLDEAEMEIMRAHVIEGEAMAADIPGLPAEVPTIVRASHERWDGGGYPDGLCGGAIPLAARIVACADALDAMTSSRSYRAALPIDLAVEVIRVESGRQFDPDAARPCWRSSTHGDPSSTPSRSPPPSRRRCAACGASTASRRGRRPERPRCGQEPASRWRSSMRRILPVSVLGSSSMNSTTRG